MANSCVIAFEKRLLSESVIDLVFTEDNSFAQCVGGGPGSSDH